MDFSEALKKIQAVLKSIGSDISQYEYDGVIVKQLKASNTLDEERSSNQTHIAITGNQMDMFPYVRADGYFEVGYDKEDLELKKYFIAQIPVYLHKENVTYLSDSAKLFNEEEQLVYVSIVRSRRKDAADQIQMSLTNIDSPGYVSYRRLVHADTYMILLKRKGVLEYDLYSVKESDGNSVLKDLNNEFYKLPTSTAVKLDDFFVKPEEQKDRIFLPFDKSRECARQIVDCIYEIDSFRRIGNLLESNDKTIKIKTDSLGGNYLRYIFIKETSEVYTPSDSVKTRVFTDKEFDIKYDGLKEKCRLSTEWVSSDFDKNYVSANYLKALIAVVNERYSDVLRIYEDRGKWYLERLSPPFRLEKLPDEFQNSFAKRYITSLLAKPFVILTGNSGTGKTRIAKQFAEYLEVCSDDGEKNWVLVPVGADWTDNTKILGFYNPLADEGRGKYEKTEILRLIEHANANKTRPYFIILDEMNLSHVERYFADFLSHMEIQSIPFLLDGYDGYVEFPENVFVVGTVNIDETTYMFSPKVLDRANVIEFKPEEDLVLDLFINPVGTNNTTPANDGTAEAFLELAKSIRSDSCDVKGDILPDAQRLFRQIYQITEKYEYEFAYRTAKEIRQYIVSAYQLLENKKSFDLVAVEDVQLLQKIMPKIHGNKKEIGQLLEELEGLCKQNNLVLSGEKIKQMKGRLAKTQYASFI